MNYINLNFSHWETIVTIFIIFFISIFVFMENDNTSSYAHVGDGKLQEWTNLKDQVKVQFTYSPERPIIDTFTSLNFSIQDLKTGEHIKDVMARVVVTNGQRLFKFENITVLNGDFSVKYIFPDDGTHQVILRISSKKLLEVASFQVFVPHQSPPSLLNSGNDMVNIIVAIGLFAAVGTITIVMLKRM